jgi:putative ABC transport system permease protein
MFKNYLITAIRSFGKNKVFTLINIVGLAIGLACSFLIFLHVYTELSYDDHFTDAKDIYRLAVKASMSDNSFEAAVTGGPLAQILEAELPEVTNYTRLREGRMTLLTTENRSFYEEKIMFADSSFFELFSFDVIAGEPEQALIHPYSMVLTEKMAGKFFGDENPIGKEIKWNNNQNYVVTGVIKNLEQKTHMDFDILVSFSTLYQSERYRNFIQNLFAYSTLNYIKVHPGTKQIDLEEKIARVVDHHMGEGLAEYGGTYDVFLQPITSIYLHSNILHELRTNSDVSFIYIFTSVAILILIIACINFINLATAKSVKRSMEVGLRKVFGANKGMLFRQFISESVILVSLSLVLAIILFDLGLPVLNKMTGNDFKMSTFLHWDYFLFVVGIAVFVGFLAGSYPALYLSRFKPIFVLKGSFFRGAKKSGFRNVMVVVQFVISVSLIAGTFLIYRQLDFINNKDLGINNKDLAVIALRDRSMTQNYKTLKAEMQNLPGVLDVTGSSAYLGNFEQRRGFFPEGGTDDNMMLMLYLQTDQNYLDVMDAKLIMGRNFFENSIADSNAILINQAYLDILGWDDPLEKNIYIPGGNDNDYPLKIIGLIENFNYASLHEEVKPLIIMNDPSRINYLSVKIKPDNQKQVLELIAAKWEAFYPAYPFEYFMQQTKYEEMYTSEANMSRLFVYFSMLAVLIAALGLFGLSSFTAEQRTKEIGIRKVLGSSVTQILSLLSKEFSRLVIIAIVIAVPLSWFGMDKWLQEFAYQTGISWWIFVVSGVLAILISYMTIIFQALKASRSNPVEALKYE